MNAQPPHNRTGADPEREPPDRGAAADLVARLLSESDLGVPRGYRPLDAPDAGVDEPPPPPPGPSGIAQAAQAPEEDSE